MLTGCLLPDEGKNRNLRQRFRLRRPMLAKGAHRRILAKAPPLNREREREHYGVSGETVHQPWEAMNISRCFSILVGFATSIYSNYNFFKFYIGDN